MNDINLVEHSRVLLAHLYSKRTAILQAIASLEVLVGEHPDVLRDLPPRADIQPSPRLPSKPPAPPRAPVEPSAVSQAPAAAAPPPPPVKPTGPPPEPSPGARAKGGKVKPGQYDGAVLRAARDAGELGLSLADATRAVVGPGRPERVQAMAGTMHGVLKRLVKAGQLTKSGRYYRLPAQED